MGTLGKAPERDRSLPPTLLGSRLGERPMKRLILNIRGLHNGGSAPTVARSLKATRGVCGVEVDTMARSACIELDEGICTIKDLISAVNRVGLQVDGYDMP